MREICHVETSSADVAESTKLLDKHPASKVTLEGETDYAIRKAPECLGGVFNSVKTPSLARRAAALYVSAEGAWAGTRAGPSYEKCTGKPHVASSLPGLRML